jgi:ketosteroid isomerase-like protein
MRTLLVTLARICLVTVAFAGPLSTAADSDVQAIHETYNAWVEAANEKDISKWSTFLAADPYFSPADSPPLTSTSAVTDYYKKSFADSWFSLDCEQQDVEVAESGEMAWARGICYATFTGPDGEKAKGTSRWFKVWVRDADGLWRGRVNTWKYEDLR